MSPPARIALLGFKAQERAALEAFFRLALKRTPAYERVPDVAQADLILLDADDDEQRSRIAELRLASRCVAVGERELPGAALQMPRPLNVLRLFTRIDRLRHPTPVEEPREAPESAGVPHVPPALSMPAAVATDAAATANAAPSGTAPALLPTALAHREPASASARAFRGLARLTGRIRRADVAATGPSAAPEPGHTAATHADDHGFATTEQLALPSDMARTVVLAPGDLPTAAAAPSGLAAAPAPAPTLAPPLMPAHERITLVGLEGETGVADEALAAGGATDVVARTQSIEQARPHEAALEAPAAPSADASDAAAAAKRQHVLVVDADDEVLRFLLAQLEPCGFALHVVRDAAKALECVGARRYHHAFVHVGDGTEKSGENGNDRGVRLAAQLRLAAQDRGRLPPAVALFGSRQALVTALTREPKAFAEVDAVLALPIDRDELLDVVGGRTLHKRAFAPTVPQSTLA